MKRILLLSVVIFALGKLASVCHAGQTTYFSGSFMCFNPLCVHWDQKYYRFVWTSTPLWVPPNNKEIEGQITDDRRCMSEQSGPHGVSWNASEGRSLQMAHTWGTTYGVAVGLLGLGTLNCGNSHTNNWSWSCHENHGTTHYDSVSYTNPEGEYGFHDIEYACDGTQYDGTECLEYWNPNLSGTLCHFTNLGPKTDKKQTRSVIVTAGDWHWWDSTCLLSEGGCGTPYMACNHSNCTGTYSDGSDCCHHP